ncbi:hypothetical protein E4U55_004217 [Claviceps digitariae]|nr:hypothetical protein E4U55_004217 [Claviceps digitariae]
MAKVEIIPFDPAQHQHLFPSIVTLHVDTIERDDVPLRFHPPFTKEKREKLTAFWKQHVQEVAEGRRITLVAVAGESDDDESSIGADKTSSDANGNSNGNTPVQSGQVLGIIELALYGSETGSFRAEVEMLIVSPSYRRHGLATKLIKEAERQALEHNRTLLLGYTEFGRLPGYAITPMTGKYVDGVYFYKDLSRRARDQTGSAPSKPGALDVLDAGF